MLDYLAWRGDITFRERPFNEVDNLILAELAYAQMRDIVPGPGSGGAVPLSAAAERYRALGYTSPLVNDPGPLLAAAGDSARFGEVRLSGYVDIIDAGQQMQFSAVRCLLPDGTMYVAYRGTDDSIVGWREDFNFSFIRTEGQADAVGYLNQSAAAFAGPLRVGGHSKGGNLAAFAAAFCEDGVKRRILQVYSNDGPGFNRAIARSAEYGSILDRLALIIPEFSVVGVLLDNRAKRQVIKSSGSGVLQHDPFTWQVRGTSFERAENQSASSILLDETLSRWLDGLDDGQRKVLVDAVFDSLEASGAETVSDVKANKWDVAGALLKAARDIDPDVRKEVLSALGKLVAAGVEVLTENVKTSFDGWRNGRKAGDGEDGPESAAGGGAREDRADPPAR